MRLIKRIPSSAGLGGASSDAAAALAAANLAWELGWSRQQLAELGAELGSDIPFFFSAGCWGAAAAVCRGRGERVEPIENRTDAHFVVVRPPVGLSTAVVYRSCRPAVQPASVQPLAAALQRGDTVMLGRSMANRLEPIAATLSPHLEPVRRLFDRLDCLGHQMSGSGAGYFGLCRSARHARRVSGRLRAAGVGYVQTARIAPALRSRYFKASRS
jgi:4-diphosphocytidyl-2-C-methyl-D-erythritol kinase